MPEMSGYTNGIPSWVDLATADIAGSLEFYSNLFGWEGMDTGAETGHYTMCMMQGRMVAAIAPAQNPEAPPYWTTYINVDDIDATSAAVTGAGGNVVFGPMDVMTQGRMAIYQDPTGAMIAAWQPGDHKGAQLVNEPGSFIWSELSSSDLDKAKDFYTAVFGWKWGGSPEYAAASVDGHTMAAAMPRPDAMPAGAPDYWLAYFAVANVDESLSRAQGAGAQLLSGPEDIPGTGRFAVLTDPQGAVFALFQP